MKEKEEAHREYKEAISKGHGAYLMDEEKPVSVKIKKKKKKKGKTMCKDCHGNDCTSISDLSHVT